LDDEKRFLFIVGGFNEMQEKIAKRVIGNYPSSPTPSKITPSKEQIQELLSKFI